MGELGMERFRVIDTHTGGEPTRVVIAGPIVLTAATMAERREQFLVECDHYRRALVCEPRGNDVMVGALLTPPVESGSAAGVIFFNNVGTLGMCGHGLIGVVAALRFLESIDPGCHRIDTPVGTVQFRLATDGRVSLENVPSYLMQENVALKLSCGGQVHGDVAWGGNWFYICHDHGLTIELSNLRQLDALGHQIRAALRQQDITGEGGAEIDHVELVGPASSPLVADARNFVLCPGGAYDRSPCGTGTSAKVACLAARGELAEGALFRQESIVGSVFTASYRRLSADRIAPTIAGQAYVTGEGELLLDPTDPFCLGIPS